MAVPDIRVIDQQTTSVSVGMPKRQETFSGVTDSTGSVTIVFNPPYSVAPNIQARILTTSKNQKPSSVTVTATGATIVVVEAVTVSLLGIDVLTLGTTPSVGVGVDILVTSK